MKEHPVLEFYDRIINAETPEDIYELSMEVKSASLSKILTDDRDIMLLNMALQIKSNFFLMKELANEDRGTTVVIMGNPEDYDPEQVQLDEFKDQEYEDFKGGNIVSMKDFTKKE